MRGRVAITTALAALLLSACVGTQSPDGEGSADDPPNTVVDGEESDEEGTMETSTAAIVTAEQIEDLPHASPYPGTRPTLAIRYTVSHEGAAPILVATERGHAQAPSSAAPDSPMAVWVSQGDENGLARLSKQVFDAPDDVDLAAPWRAPAELLDAGAVLEGYVVVPLPLQGDLPTAGPALILTVKDLTGTPTRVEVCLHVVPFADGMAQDEIHMGMPGGLACSDPFSIPPERR